MSEKRFFCRRKTIIDGTTILRAEEIVDLLNSLVDENEQLRKELYIEQTDCKNIRESREYWRNKAEALEEENEQLKHWNKCLAEKRHNEKESNESLIKKLIGKIDFLERIIDGEV